MVGGKLRSPLLTTTHFVIMLVIQRQSLRASHRKIKLQDIFCCGYMNEIYRYLCVHPDEFD